MPALVPAQPPAPALEAASPDTAENGRRPGQTAESRTGLPRELITLQQAADAAHRQLEQLHDPHERDLQRRAWRDAAEAAQTAVTHYARTKRLNRYEVEKKLRQIVRHSGQ